VRREKLLDNGELSVLKPARDSSRGPTSFNPSFRLFVNLHLPVIMSHIKPLWVNQRLDYRTAEYDLMNEAAL